MVLNCVNILNTCIALPSSRHKCPAMVVRANRAQAWYTHFKWTGEYTRCHRVPSYSMNLLRSSHIAMAYQTDHYLSDLGMALRYGMRHPGPSCSWAGKTRGEDIPSLQLRHISRPFDVIFWLSACLDCCSMANTNVRSSSVWLNAIKFLSHIIFLAVSLPAFGTSLTLDPAVLARQLLPATSSRRWCRFSRGRSG